MISWFGSQNPEGIGLYRVRMNVVDRPLKPTTNKSAVFDITRDSPAKPCNFEIYPM